MPITEADAETVGYEPKELIVNLVAKALLSEHDEDKAQGYVAFVRDALESWFTNEQDPKSDTTPVFETDQIKHFYDLLTHRNLLVDRFHDQIKNVVFQSCDNLLDDANAIKSLRMDIVEGALPVMGPKKQRLLKQIHEEYTQRMLQLEETKKILVDNMDVMEKFKKSNRMMDDQKKLQKIDGYCIEKWTKVWAEQRKKAGGPTCSPLVDQKRTKGGEEKTKEKWEFEAKKWSQECAMFAIFNEFLLTHLADSHSGAVLMEACVNRQDNELKDMEKRMKITENVINAKHKREIEELKEQHVKSLDTMKLRLDIIQGLEIIEDGGSAKTAEEKQEILNKEINRVFIETLSADDRANGFSKGEALLKMEKENQEIADGDRELQENMQRIRAMAISHIHEKSEANYKMLYEKHQKKITITSHSGDMLKNEMIKIFERRLENRDKEEERNMNSSKTSKSRNTPIPSKSSKKRAAKKLRQAVKKAEQSSEIDKTEENDSDCSDEEHAVFQDPKLKEMLEKINEEQGNGRHVIDYSKEYVDPEDCESEDEEMAERRKEIRYAFSKDKIIADLDAKLKEISLKLEETEQAYLSKDRQLSAAQNEFLRRGMGLSRGQIDKRIGMKNGINQYM